MTYLRADADDMTLACPNCDAGQRWYVRTDDTVRCPECEHECHRDDLVERPSEKGEHTPREACAKGGRVSMERHGPPQQRVSDERMQEIASLPKGPRTGPLAED